MAGGGEELKLLGTWASPFVIRVKLALSFKGLSYENLEEEDLYYNKSELLLKSNPVHKQVPVLIHNGKSICESQLIVQYIDEAFSTNGPSLLAVEPYERAMARFWGAYIDDKGKDRGGKGRGTEADVRGGGDPGGSLQGPLKGKPFFGGDSVGYLDIVLGGLIPMVYYGEARYGIELFDDTRSPLLVAWVERFGALDAAKAILPDVALKQTFAAVETLEAAFKDLSKGKPFFGGDSVGYLDIVLGGLIPMVYYGEARYGIELFDDTRSPLLVAWVERFGALDAAKAILPDVDKLVEYSKMKQARAAAMATDTSSSN
ncbi:unnamed protein product [Miscanthus lutarioriparius]|uniref:glutathione transferase n=1 Tax=Miscanthus lutarioriparius TaxID=422564 RepID=A0A811MEB4_9POAL|nr:unnamed protein product [Miscanthus lutarioriparius]